jgi:hypothetical protein
MLSLGALPEYSAACWLGSVSTIASPSTVHAGLGRKAPNALSSFAANDCAQNKQQASTVGQNGRFDLSIWISLGG